MNTTELHGLDPSYRIEVLFEGSEDSRIRSDKIYNALRDDVFMVQLRQLAWESYCEKMIPDKKQNAEEVYLQVRSVLEESCLKEVISNTALKIYERSSALFTRRSQYDHTSCKSRHAEDEPVSSIREARISWEIGINEELQVIASETKNTFSFIAARPPGVAHPLLEQAVPPPSSRENVRFLFDSEDLLETAANIRSSNMTLSSLSRNLGIIKVPIDVPSLDDLITRYMDLSPIYSQIGMDDLSTNPYCGSSFCVSRHEEGESLLSSVTGSALAVRKYLRRGAPPSLRGQLWRVALGLPSSVSSAETQTLASLHRNCDRSNLLTDELYIMDVFHVTDDTRYFVFEEELRLVALCFSRDSWILENSEYVIHKPLLCTINDPEAGGREIQLACPPCGVQPFLGLASYFCPLFYVFRDTASLYSVAKGMFTRLWCRMNVLSGDPGTLIHVCRTFENLLASVHIRLYLHLISIGVQPLQIAFSWLQLGFVGTLEVDQILLLWDRILGYMDVTLLAVLAAAIFVFRAEPLLQCKTSADAISLLSEDSRIRVVPLLQMFLYSDKKDS